jgi:hypothetical protein
LIAESGETGLPQLIQWRLRAARHAGRTKIKKARLHTLPFY